MIDKYKRLINIGEDPLTDNQYLEQYILNLYKFRSNEICWIKDLNSIYIADSRVHAKMHGFPTINKAIGKKDEDALCQVSDFADILCEQDRIVESTRERTHTLDVLEFNTGLTIHYTTKYPIINPSTNRVLGTFGYGPEFSLNSGLKTILDIHKRRFGTNPSIYISSIIEHLKLTNREMEVLYCICLGFGDRKSIANFLSIIHKKTIQVSTVIDEAFKGLYKKLPCKSSSQLLEFAIHNNLHLQIPKSFIPIGSFILK